MDISKLKNIEYVLKLHLNITILNHDVIYDIKRN